MQDRFAFTAGYWGEVAVVCRAIEDRPWPVAELEFGEFETWTQAKYFATCLNEGLDIHYAEAEQIITSAFLCTNEALRAMRRGPWESRRRNLAPTAHACGPRSGSDLKAIRKKLEKRHRKFNEPFHQTEKVSL